MVNYTEASNEVARQTRLDLVDKARDLAHSRMVIYQLGLHRYHSR
jgi:hypothetical protein